MAYLTSCDDCGGFVPRLASACPNCGCQTDRSRNALRVLLNVAGGGAVAMTLMACYGPPPHAYPEPATPDLDTSCRSAEDDIDKDGFCADDCDEVNPQVHPGADDPVGDGIDQDCDGADGIRGAEMAQ